MLHRFKQYRNIIKSLEQGSPKIRYQNAQTDKNKEKELLLLLLFIYLKLT